MLYILCLLRALKIFIHDFKMNPYFLKLYFPNLVVVIGTYASIPVNKIVTAISRFQITQSSNILLIYYTVSIVLQVTTSRFDNLFPLFGDIFIFRLNVKYTSTASKILFTDSYQFEMHVIIV